MPQRPRGALGQRRAACWCCCWPSRWIIVGLLPFRAQQLAIMASVCDLGRTTWCLAERWGNFGVPIFVAGAAPAARHCSTHFSYLRCLFSPWEVRGRDPAEHVPTKEKCSLSATLPVLPRKAPVRTVRPRTQGSPVAARVERDERQLRDRFCTRSSCDSLTLSPHRCACIAAAADRRIAWWGRC